MKPEGRPFSGRETVRRDARGRAERWARRGWRDGPGPWLRASGALYGAASRTWTFGYETGLLRARLPVLPTISVGGVTVGGSGKTPFAAEIARLVAASGRRPAVITRGFPDELALHARLSRGWPVFGCRDRRAAIREAAAVAQVAVLDDGFQHRRLARDLDIVLLDADLVGRVPWRLLPAGPFREPPSALSRADVLVVTRRGAAGPDAEVLASWTRRHTEVPLVARCALEPGGLERVGGTGTRNATTSAAEPRTRKERAEPPSLDAPGWVVVAGIMKPEPFLRSLRERGLRPELEVVLPDHGAPSPGLVAEIARAAARGGVITTAKDAERLGPLLPEGVPLWRLGERLTWEEGADELRERVEETAAREAAVYVDPAEGTR